MLEGRGNAWRAPQEVPYMCPGLSLSLSVYVCLCFCEYTSVCVSVFLCVLHSLFPGASGGRD